MPRSDPATVVVNWNGHDDTIRCLEGLRAAGLGLDRILVVDNGSAEDSVRAIRSAFPELMILRNETNLGYCGGYNAGLRHWLAAGEERVLLLNNDARVADGALEALGRAADRHPLAGLLGPKVRIAEQQELILSAGGMLPADLQPMHRGLGEVDRGQFDRSEPVAYLSGCALLVTRPAIEAAGLLDEAYFAYYEDVDWSLRIQARGFETRYVPRAVVWHPDTRTRDPATPSIVYYMTRNRLRFLRRHAGRGARLRQVAIEIRTLASRTLRARAGRGERPARLRGLVDHWRGYTGAVPPSIASAGGSEAS